MVTFFASFLPLQIVPIKISIFCPTQSYLRIGISIFYLSHKREKLMDLGSSLFALESILNHLEPALQTLYLIPGDQESYRLVFNPSTLALVTNRCKNV